MGMFHEAIQNCSKAIELSNRSLTLEAIHDCSQDIELLNITQSAYYQRGKLYRSCKMYRGAINDFANLIQNTAKLQTNELQIQCFVLDLENAQRLCAAKEIPNYYDILNIKPTDTNSDIRKRFKELAKHMHPGTYIFTLPPLSNNET